MESKNVYIIGEIGQNHNGSVDLAKLIIDLACRPIEEDLFGLKLQPMNAVKLTKRDLKQELSKSQMDAAYNSPHAFASTYGAHREVLELNDEQHFEIYKYAKEKGVDFVETLCAIGCLSLLKLFTPDYLKVASRDLTNLPLLEALAETQIPIIVSTGMAGKKELDDAIGVITKYHNNLSILHCVSQYPTHPKNTNLNTIPFLQKNYPDYKIGYSDHTIGIATPLAAVAMGAEIIEKHITIDRRMKGTDQAGSLGPDGVNRMVRDIRLFEGSLGVEDIFIEDDVKAAKVKLERSIATLKDLKAGDIITADDLHLLSPGDGLKWSERDTIIGKTINKDIAKDEIIYSAFINF
ncbi:MULTISPECIES: N-acetylneuraminate synthase family protein [Sphingobacterium]|uniref:N-acetylneuraminate synthase family protein n=1 Tax=Sphingobacterium ginsenosidimutans TaxID=687845 RepID=A0ABP8A1U4_9SPHI|nr:N-acetylneuraminate synthase family protein [Sphingobacterium sp. BIGb0165]MCS4227907.1 sialic acid synthase [Sphingobacterium sp. BIGb0165]